jgi:hypothetical protein
MCKNRNITDSTRKRHKNEDSAKYNKTRVSIGDEYDRWTELKDILMIKTHKEVAKILLDRCDFFCFGLKLLT